MRDRRTCTPPGTATPAAAPPTTPSGCTGRTGRRSPRSRPCRRWPEPSADQSDDRPHRDRQPARSVPGLVAHLVGRLVEFVGGEQVGLLVGIGAPAGGISLAERCAVAFDPFAGAGSQLLVVPGIVPPLDETLVGGVLVGPQYTRDVPQR